MKRKLLLTAMLAASFTASAAEHAHWGYEGQEDPAHWGKLSPDFSLCETGKNQSPVNIQGALKTHHGQLELAFQPGKQQIVNNGHTIQVNVSAGNTLKLDGDTFSASAEQITQFRSAIHHTNNRPVQPLNGRVIVD